MKKTRATVFIATVCTLTPGAAPQAAPLKISVDAQAVSAAARLDAPISQVTVFSDRARVRRRGRFPKAGGVKLYRLPELPGAVDLPTVRVRTERGRIVRVEANPVERARFEITGAGETIDRLEAVQHDLRKIDAALARESGQMAWVRNLQPASLTPENKREGRPAPPIDLTGWSSSQAFLQTRSRRHADRIAALKVDQRKLDEERTRLITELRKKDLGGFSQRVVEVSVVADAANGPFELEYFVQGASWKPAYVLDFDPKRSKLTLRTSATVQQACGEDWNDADLEFSTAIPGRGIALPELLTWTLGETRDFVLKPRPKGALPTASQHSIPPPRPTPEDEARQSAADALQARLADALGDPKTVYKRRTVIDFENLQIDGDLSKPEGSFLSAPNAAPTDRATPSPEKTPPRPAQAQEAPMAVAPAAADSDVEELVVISAGFGGARARSRWQSSRRAERVSLALFDEPPPPPRFTDPDLPAVSAGGLDYVFKAPTKQTVPSTGELLRVPLTSRTYDAQTVFLASPGLRDIAYAQARIKNGSELPILRGPTSVFFGGRFVAEGRIETTGPGGTLDFGLGADENVRLIRKVVPKSETKGFFSKEDVTAYTTTIEIGNYKKIPITIEILDQIPMSQHEDVEVRLTSTAPAPTDPVSKRGMLRWSIPIAAGKTEKIAFEYQISRPRDWQLRQHDAE